MGPRMVTADTLPWIFLAMSVLKTAPGLVLMLVARVCAADWAL